MLTAKNLMMMHGRAAVNRTASLKECANKFISTGFPGLPVVGRDLKVVGVVTEFDLLGALREGLDVDKTTVERIMTKEPCVAEMNTSAEELIETMLEQNYTIVPVVRNKKLVGVVGRTEILSAYIEPKYYWLKYGGSDSSR
jgi:arabinose-5-phosphate isomerase